MTLEVTHLSARRGARQVLADVSFTANRGEILGVIGPNGAGKTTLFECVAGVLPFDGGKIDSDLLFYVPDAIRPWPDQTVRWTLTLTARMFATQFDSALLDDLDLVALQHATVRSLSKGEAKRLDIAVGLASPRTVLLLDEPFDGLDLRQTRQVMEILRRDAAKGRTLVLSIHQLSDAARACDRFLLLDHGRSVAEGTLNELTSRTGAEGLEEVFLALT
ncbi:MAG: type transport system ATP-binding protein [Thermoanaerobaculia bacterium]|jgi:ABC-type multidrug transport system ATPase subunit|nr:type transport system ATP-binding protein [Thermoanaerobaculia bacterium]